MAVWAEARGGGSDLTGKKCQFAREENLDDGDI